MVLVEDHVAAYLGAQASVLAIAPADRVFGRELPESEDEAMPRPTVVVSRAGGPGGAGDLPLDAQRVDVRSYGETPWQADRLATAAHLALKELRREVVDVEQPDSTVVRALLHSATPSGGFIGLREPATRWPLTLRSYVVLFDEREVA